MTTTGPSRPRGQQRPRVLRPSLVRELNLGVLMQELRTAGAQPRLQLAASTGLSAAAVTKLTATLIDAGIVVEMPLTSDATRGAGRPRVPLQLTPDARAAFGLHLGADRVSMAMVDLRATVARRVDLDLNPDVAGRREPVVRAAAMQLREWVDGPRSPVVIGVGVTCDDAWHDLDLPSILEQVTGWSIRIDDVVHSTTSWLRQTLHLERDLLHLHIDGVARCVLVIDGQLRLGAHERAGQLHHWTVPDLDDEVPQCDCGRPNCFSQVTTSAALVARARRQGVISAGQGETDLLREAAGGNRAAEQLLDDRLQWVGQLLSAAADLIDPAQLLITGSVLDWPPFMTRLRTLLETSGDRRVYRLHRPDGPLDLAAAAAAPLLDNYFSDPAGFEPLLRRDVPD